MNNISLSKYRKVTEDALFTSMRYMQEKVAASKLAGNENAKTQASSRDSKEEQTA